MFRCTSHSLRKETYNFYVILPHKHEVLPHLTSQRSVSRHIWPPFSSPCSVSSGVVQQRKMYDLITDHSQPLTGPQFNNTNYSLFGIQDQTPDHLQNYNTVLHPIKVSRYPIYWSHVLVGMLNWGTLLIIFKKSLLPVAVLCRLTFHQKSLHFGMENWSCHPSLSLFSTNPELPILQFVVTELLRHSSTIIVD